MPDTNPKWQPAEVLVTFTNDTRGEAAEVVATQGECLLNGRLEDHPALAARYLRRAPLRVLPSQDDSVMEPASIGRRLSLQMRVVYLTEQAQRRAANGKPPTEETA